MIIDREMQKEKKNRSDDRASRLLDLYIRNNKKQAILLHTPPNASLQQIHTLVQNRFRVPPEQQVLYYNGLQLQAEGTVEVEDRAILHLVDRRNVTPELVINVRRLNVPKPRRFRVPASQIIQDFIVREIQQEESNRFFFVYTGRELNPRSTFGDEFVENESELFCLDEVGDQLVGERRSKYEKRGRKRQQKERESTEGTAAPISQSKVITIRPIGELQLNRNNMCSTAPVDDKREEEAKTPNFKKKTMSEEVCVGGDVQPQSNEISTSLVAEQPLQENKSGVAQNTLFNESISSIFLQQNHNPESRQREQASVMFQSAIIGLNNESVITPQPFSSRAGSFINNQPDSHQEETQNLPSKTSFSFDNRAPEMIPHERQVTAYDQEEIIEESKEDYTESKEISVGDCEQESHSKAPEKIQREKSKDLSGYELQSVENHQLSASADLQMEMFETKNSPNRNDNSNQILIQDFDREQSKTLEYLGVQIEPIEHTHHESQTQQGQKKEQEQRRQDELQTPHFDPTPRHVDVYLIEEQDLAQPTESQMVEEKEERETNRYSNSNFYSSNSSRARHYDANNEYNFGQFEKVNKNRFSGCREGTQRYQPELQASLSEHHQPMQDCHPFLFPVQEVKKELDDKSLNIVELPVEAHIKDNSLLDYDSKSDLIYNENHFRSKPAELPRQSSGIDELNKLFSQIDKPPLDKANSVVKVAEGLPSNESMEKEPSEPSLVDNEHPHQDVVETSLNLRMSDRLPHPETSSPESSSPLIKQTKCLLQSSQSLQKIEVKNSLPYFNSYSRSISSEMRFTSRKEIYNIGDFVFTSDINTFDPFAFFVESLARQEFMDIYRSYP